MSPRAILQGRIGCACALGLLWTTSGALAQDGSDAADMRLDTITVRGVRETEAGPMPGLTVTRDQIPGNMQSAGKKEIEKSQAIGITDFMNTQMQSVSVSDYSGNPFQADLNYRGFTASPQLGTPQGLSVFFDGIRVNEPFGDVVNWDLIPMNAIDRMDVFPGSNPLFGLNTLGGAISLRTKNGFTAPGVEAQVLGGSWGRKQVKLAAGGNNGVLGGFGALTYFDEDGWRDNSPTTVQQFFGRTDLRGQYGTIGMSLLAAGNDLIGNGLIPTELWQQRPETVFTSPDQTKNNLLQYSIFGTLDVTDSFNISGQIYRRDSKRRGVNGDIYEGFEDMTDENDSVRRIIPLNNTAPLCQWLDADRDGRRDSAVVISPIDGSAFETVLNPLNDPQNLGLCDQRRIRVTNGARRNGAATNPASAGVVEGTPIGLISNTAIDQITDGGALQFNWNLERHKFMVGASLDASATDYRMAQRLALIDPSHNVYEDPANIDPIYRAAQADVRANDFDGTSRTRSLYFSETWSMLENLHWTFAARYNHTNVKTRLKTRSAAGTEAGDLHNLKNYNVVPSMYILCPTPDPASCPPAPEIVLRDVNSLPETPTQEEFNYESLNPALGLNWLPNPDLNLFFNVSQGTRTPSVIELGCAFDPTPVDVNAGVFDVNGAPLPALYKPRSLIGPTCALPSTLSGDPFLPQIQARSAEVGARGKLTRDWDWNASVFRTDLKDDIYFVGVSAERSFFDTIGKTRRQGIELGVAGKVGKATLRFNYSLVDATFQSTFYVLSPHNSSADFDQNSQPSSAIPSPTASANGSLGTYRMTRVDPGAKMPGIPMHNFNAGVDYSLTSSWSIGLNMIAHSSSYVRGNENNAHQASGTDSETIIYESSPIPCTPAGNCGSVTGGGQTTGRPFHSAGRVPGFAIFNLQTSYKVTKQLSLFGQVTNLFDTSYFTAGRLGVNPFSPSVVGAVGSSGWNYNSNEWQNTTFVGPGAPRAFWIGVNIYLGGAGEAE